MDIPSAAQASRIILGFAVDVVCSASVTILALSGLSTDEGSCESCNIWDSGLPLEAVELVGPAAEELLLGEGNTAAGRVGPS